MKTISAVLFLTLTLSVHCQDTSKKIRYYFYSKQDYEWLKRNYNDTKDILSIPLNIIFKNDTLKVSQVNSKQEVFRKNNGDVPCIGYGIEDYWDFTTTVIYIHMKEFNKLPKKK